MKFHPYAEIFPLIEGAAFDELVADIKLHGLREKIWLYEGKILDGRNRYLACQKANIKLETRKYEGSNPLAFVISLNVQRRHLTESQRAMAAARVATLRDGQRKSPASIEAPSQSDAADSLNVGRSSVQRARKVIEEGSKALQRAVDTGEISVSKAARVVDLPKSEQLAAASAKPERDDDDPEADADELQKLEAMERELNASVDKVMKSDDRLAAAYEEIKRQAAEIGALKISRDGFMNGKGEMVRLLKKEQSKSQRLTKENERLTRENEQLKKRAA
jgi:hypothetical protein